MPKVIRCTVQILRKIRISVLVGTSFVCVVGCNSERQGEEGARTLSGWIAPELTRVSGEMPVNYKSASLTKSRNASGDTAYYTVRATMVNEVQLCILEEALYGDEFTQGKFLWGMHNGQWLPFSNVHDQPMVNQSTVPYKNGDEILVSTKSAAKASKVRLLLPVQVCERDAQSNSDEWYYVEFEAAE